MPPSSVPGTFSRRTPEPVASSAFSKLTSCPSERDTARSEASSPVTETRVRTSTCCSWYHSGGRNSVSSRDSSSRRYPFEQGGRLYGRSGSRPISRIEPSAPDSRSHRAQLPAASPPPRSRYSTCRSAIVGWAGAVRRKPRRDLRLESWVENQQDLVAGLDHGVGLRHESGAAAQHGDDQGAVGQLDLLDPPAGCLRTLADLHLDDLEVLLLQREHLDQPVLRDLVPDESQDQVGRGDRRLDAEQAEVLEVPRVVDARDDPLDAVLLLRHLRDQDVVLVVAGDGDHQVRALNPGALEHPELGRVAVLDRVLELLLDHPVAMVVGLDQRHLALLGDQLARE